MISEAELVHIKDSVMQDRPLCCFDAGKDGLTWTTRTSMKIATCPECVHEVLMDKCGVCNERGFIQEYNEEWPCRSCDGEAWIEQQHRPATP